MIGTLSSTEIENLLNRQLVGRIGCRDNNSVYIVPISYAYDGTAIFCHSLEGKKLELMRNNPEVCFQVDEMEDMANWKSVVTWGTFEELTNASERNAALDNLLSRKLPIRSSVTTHLGKTWPFVGNGSNGYNEITGVIFKIHLKGKSGKFEQTSISPSQTIN